MNTITNEQARELFYYWHASADSAFYQAASAGLVLSWDRLTQELHSMDDGADKQRLQEWLSVAMPEASMLCYQGRHYHALPWVHMHYIKAAM